MVEYWGAMKQRIRWGILGTGSIARQMAEALKPLDDAELAAVGSRSQKSADRFGREYGIPRRHAGYAALARDPDVDVVYVATPHTLHRDHTLLCLDHGKAVLCEKPLALNGRQVREMVDRARARRLFLMEAMWTHCFPAMAKLREQVRSGAIGDVRMLEARFCVRVSWNPAARHLNPELGGGALLDLGVYDVALAHMVFGRAPTRITGLADIGKTGVDEQSAVVLGYEDGALAVLTSALRTMTPHAAAVYGTDGWIRIPAPFWQPDRIVVHHGERQKEFRFERLGNGYSFEAAEVMRCLRAGRLESEIVPLDLSQAVTATMDALRAQWDLTYPGEKS